MHSLIYHLIPDDLRSPPQDALSHALVDSSEGPILSRNLPTLIVFECVLAYMSPAASNGVIQWFADYLSMTTEGAVLGGIVYEMFGLNDSFGKVMLNNLKVCIISISASPKPIHSLTLCVLVGEECRAPRGRALPYIHLLTQPFPPTWLQLLASTDPTRYSEIMCWGV